MSLPSYGQRSDPRAAPDCPRHPGVRSVDYCKRCNRPMCVDCLIPTEVRSICVDCTSSKRGWVRQASRAAQMGAPVVTYAMMAICVLVYAVTLLTPSVGASLALVPALLASHPWMILTQAFVHIGFFHIVFNMLTLYVVGRSIEPVLGWWRYLIVYLVSALGGSAFILAWCLLQPQYAFASAAGASAASELDEAVAASWEVATSGDCVLSSAALARMARGVSDVTRSERAARLAAPATPTRARNGRSRDIDFSFYGEKVDRTCIPP